MQLHCGYNSVISGVCPFHSDESQGQMPRCRQLRTQWQAEGKSVTWRNIPGEPKFPELQKHRTSLRQTSVLLGQNLRTFTQRSPMFSISGIGIADFFSFVRWKCVLRGWRGGMPVIPQRKCVYSLLICLNFNFTIWQTTLNGLFNNFFSVPQNLTLCQQIMRKESAVAHFFLFYLHDSFAGLMFLWSSLAAELTYLESNQSTNK